MTPGHVAVLKSYSLYDITPHRAGTCSGDMNHRPNHNMYTQNKLRDKFVPGTSIHHFTLRLRGMLQACVAGTCSDYKITTNTDIQLQQREHVSGTACSGGEFLFRSHLRDCSRRLYWRRAAVVCEHLYFYTCRKMVQAFPWRKTCFKDSKPPLVLF